MRPRSGAAGDGWLCWRRGLGLGVELAPAELGAYDEDGAGLPGVGLAGLLPQQGRLVRGGICLVLGREALLLPRGCRTLPGARSRAAPRRQHHAQREAGIWPLPWEGSPPPQPLSALSAVLGCGIRAAAKTPPHPAAPEPGKSSTRWTRSWSRRERGSRWPAPPTEPRRPSDPT